MMEKQEISPLLSASLLELYRRSVRFSRAHICRRRRAGAYMEEEHTVEHPRRHGSVYDPDPGNVEEIFRQCIPKKCAVIHR